MWSSKLRTNIQKSIIAYQTLTRMPVKEANWEYVLHQAAERSKLPVLWTPGSHKSGADIEIDGKSYSCKTTRTASKTKHINISSYRLTRHASGTDPMKFIREIDEVRANYEHYALLVRTTSASSPLEVSQYHVYRIPSTKLKAHKLEWQRSEQGDWIGHGYEFSMTIKKSMSYQLWLQVSKDFIVNDIELEVRMPTKIPTLNLVDIYEAVKHTSNT